MHRHFARALVVVFLFAGTAFAQPPAPKHKIVATDRQTVTATITYEMKTTKFAVTKWMVFLPEPPELPSQGKVKTTATPGGKLVTERSPLARTVRYFELSVANPVPGGGLSLKLEVEATLRARTLVELQDGEAPPAVVALTATEKKYYLSSTTCVDHDAKPFQAWLDAKELRRGKTETPTDFAARVLEVIRADYTYHYDPEEDKRASVACKANATDCGGMTYLFVAAMRASGVPARALVGRQAITRKPGTTAAQQDHERPHVRAELYVAGVGWVPVDPSYARSGKSKPVATFVGHDPGDLLVLHLDVDLQLRYPDRVRETQLLQLGPHYWSKGNGTFDGYFGPTGWELKATPFEKK